MKPTRTELGRLIRERRLSLKLILGEAATRAKVSNATFSRIERGEHFSPSAVKKICQALELKVPPEVLYNSVIHHDGQNLSFTLSADEFTRYLAELIEPVRSLQANANNPVIKLILEVLLAMMQEEHDSYSFVLEKHLGRVELKLFRIVHEGT